MIVKITYDDQRLDVFDTNTFTGASPLGKQNALTNFEVRFDTFGDEGLWLAAHSYQIDQAYKKDADAHDVPVGRRTKGWRFLLSSAEELEHVELVVVDGEAIIKRVCGELIDLQSFDEKAYECIGSSSKGLHERMADLYAYLQLAEGITTPHLPGIPDDVRDQVLGMCARISNKNDEDTEEDWGDLDEAGW